MNKAEDLADDLKDKNGENVPEDKKSKDKGIDSKRGDSFMRKKSRILDLIE